MEREMKEPLTHETVVGIAEQARCRDTATAAWLASVCHSHELLRARLDAAEQGKQWQPISRHPNFGQKIIVWSERDGFGFREWPIPIDDPCGWTHWMPRPAKPSKEATDEIVRVWRESSKE